MSNIVDCLFSISSLILRILFPIIILGIEKPIEEGIEIKSTLYNQTSNNANPMFFIKIGMYINCRMKTWHRFPLFYPSKNKEKTFRYLLVWKQLEIVERMQYFAIKNNIVAPSKYIKIIKIKVIQNVFKV